jgi:hypothetical protein
MANTNTTGRDTTNDANARMNKQHITGQGYEHRPQPRFVFGNPEELHARVGGSHPTVPDKLATTFEQLPPGATAPSIYSQRIQRREGVLKFAADPGAYLGDKLDTRVSDPVTKKGGGQQWLGWRKP